MRSWQYALIALGVFVWVIAVFLMVEGKMEKDEYIKKLEEFEETLMGTILRFYRFKG